MCRASCTSHVVCCMSCVVCRMSCVVSHTSHVACRTSNVVHRMLHIASCAQFACDAVCVTQALAGLKCSVWSNLACSSTCTVFHMVHIVHNLCVHRKCTEFHAFSCAQNMVENARTQDSMRLRPLDFKPGPCHPPASAAWPGLGFKSNGPNLVELEGFPMEVRSLAKRAGKSAPPLLELVS